MKDHRLNVRSEGSTTEKEYEIDFSFILAHLPTRERNALKTLAITCVDAFSAYDFSQLFFVRGYGETTVARLQELQKRIRTIKEGVTDSSDPISLLGQSMVSFPLNARERSALTKFDISNWKEFACFDFQQAGDVSNLGTGTLHTLLAKQMDVREKIIFDTMNSDTVFSCDDEFSVFTLHLSLGAKKTLWDLGITRISELVHTDLTFLKNVSTSLEKVYAELCPIQKENYSTCNEINQGWTQEATEETLNTLPFFNGKPNHCKVCPLHASFFPNLNMDKIIQGSLSQALKQMGIFTLGDLLMTSSSHILLFKHCSKGKINGIRTRIRKLLFPASMLPRLPLDTSTPKTFLVSLFRNYVRSDRAVEILVQRLNGNTLESIAKQYGLTRERIRQLESKHKKIAGPVIAWKSFEEVRHMLENSLLKLGGFAHIKQITEQFAADNGWSEQDCSLQCVRFLLDSMVAHFKNYGKIYYAMSTYPCGHCNRLTTNIFRICNQKNTKMPNRHILLGNLSQTCCAQCVETPQRLTESFMDWKCASDGAYRRILDEGNIYRSSRSSMQRMAFHILKEASRPLNVREILAEVRDRAENKHFTERQVKTAVTCLCASNNDIFLWNRGSIYVHRKHIPIEGPFFVTIEKQLKKLIKNAQTPYISLYALFSKYQTECETHGIPSSHALYACLKARGIRNVTFMRSPYISVTGERHKRRNIDLLENWVAQQQGVVTTQSLKDYALEIGLNSHRYDGTLSNLKSVVRYEAKSVVHLQTLEWNQKKEDALRATALNYWQKCIAQGAWLARTDDLVAECKAKLPPLGNGIPWTSDLIFSLLSRSDSLLLFGNTYLAYGFPTEDCRIRTFGDIVVEVLKKQFGGRTTLNKMSSYLKNDLRILRLRLTPGMVHNQPDLVIEGQKIYLVEGQR